MSSLGSLGARRWGFASRDVALGRRGITGGCSLLKRLAIGVGRNGRHATLKNALSDIASFGLSRPEAVAMAQDMQKTVKARWESLFRDNGFIQAEIERYRTCFIACDEAIDNEPVAGG
jgi:hypothetical protein